MLSKGVYLDGISDSSSWSTIASNDDFESSTEGLDLESQAQELGQFEINSSIQLQNVSRSNISDKALHDTEVNELHNLIECDTSIQHDLVLSDASVLGQQNVSSKDCHQIKRNISEKDLEDIGTTQTTDKSIDEEESYTDDIDLQDLIVKDDSSNLSVQPINLYELEVTALEELEEILRIKEKNVQELQVHVKQVLTQKQQLQRQQQRVHNASISLAKNVFTKNKLNFKLRILLLLSTFIITLLSLSSVIVGFFYMANNQWLLGAFAIAAALIPSLYSAILDRIWTIRLYEANQSIKPSLHFVSGILLALINLESLYYPLKYRKILPNDYEKMKMVALLINDCQQLMIFGLLSQAIAHISVQTFTVVEYRDFILPLPCVIFIICQTIGAIITAGLLNFSYKFNSIFGSEWRVTLLNFILKGPSMALYVLDVFTDWFLVVRYLLVQQWLFATLTLLFIIGPSFFITWNSRYYTSYGIRNHIIKSLIGVYNLEPIVQHWNSVKSIFKIKQLEINNQDEDQFDEFKWLARNEFNVQVLISYECYMESAMQFILQIAIAASERNIGVSRLVSIIMSLTSIAMSIILLNKKNRISGNVSKDDADPTATLDPMPMGVILLYFLSTLFTVGPRILVFSLFASICPSWTAVFIITNSALVAIHLIYANMCTTFEQLIAGAMAGFVSIFKPIESISKKAEIGYHVIYWLQNIVFCYIWYSFNTTVSLHFALYLCIICIVLPIFGWVCHFVFWKFQIRY